MNTPDSMHAADRCVLARVRITLHAQVTSDRLLARGVGAAQLADVWRHLHQPALQPARPDRRRRTSRTSSRSGCCRTRCSAPGSRRRSSSTASCTSRSGPTTSMALDAKTGRVFWLYRYTPSPDARVCCGSNNRGVAILGDTLFMGTLDAHLVAIDAKNGRPLWNVAVADVEARVLDHAGAARRQGQGDRRRRRRRVRHPRLHRRVRRAHRQGSVALLHDSRARRAGHETWKGDAWKYGGGSVWVTGSYDPDAEPDLLGRRQSRPGLESRSAARRQPLHRLGRRARRRHRRAEVAFPVHAERRLRLRLGAGPGARRHELARARRRS